MLKVSVKQLKLVSIIYLVLPVFLFFFLWLKLYLAIVFTFIFFFPVAKNIRNLSGRIYEIKWFSLILFLGAIILWVSVSGAGGFGLQSHDLLKANAISHDLILGNPPLEYIFNNQNYYLSTYLGYYLPIPIVFGFLSWETVMFLIYLFTTFGVVLSLLWFSLLIDKIGILIPIFFIFISGLDILGFLHTFNSIQPLLSNFFDFEPVWYNSPGKVGDKMLLLFPSNTHTLFWGPQHAITGWLCSGMFFYEFNVEKNNRFSPTYLATIPFWSPFIAIGIAPYLLIAVIRDGWKKYLNLNNVFLLIVFLILYLFVNSIPMSSVNKGIVFDTGEGRLGYSLQLKNYLSFIFNEILIWAIPTCLILYKKIKNSEFNLLLFTVFFACLLPLYSLGLYNDWSQRCPIPVMFLFWTFVYKAFENSRKIVPKFALIILFILGSWDSVYFIARSLKATDGKIVQNVPDFDNQLNYFQISEQQKWPIYHSFALESSFFYKHLAKNSNKPIQVDSSK